jgi:hypothetical protein
MPDNAWRNLAEDAINELFKEYVGDQVLMLIRQQIGMSQFVTNITGAKDKRVEALDAISEIP